MQHLLGNVDTPHESGDGVIFVRLVKERPLKSGSVCCDPMDGKDAQGLCTKHKVLQTLCSLPFLSFNVPELKGNAENEFCDELMTKQVRERALLEFRESLSTRCWK